MIGVTYTTTGAEAVRRDLAKLRLEALQAEIAAVLDDIAADTAAYPPPPAGTRYHRTNKLHDAWLDADPTFNLSGATLLAVLTNPISYGPYVQGAGDQASVHAGRWRTTEAIMDAWESRVAARVEDAIGRVIGL